MSRDGFVGMAETLNVGTGLCRQILKFKVVLAIQNVLGDVVGAMKAKVAAAFSVAKWCLIGLTVMSIVARN